MKLNDTMAIPDVQGFADTRQLAINKVGIKSIRHPVRVMDKGGGVQHTIAVFNMYVGLPHNFKGTHMSRFVEILNSHDARSPSRTSSRCCARWSSAWRPRPATSR
jgi:GTP cyclohydrolase I